MSDQLHDLMTRIAEQAGPGPQDPTLWARARKARRLRRRLRAVAVGALVLAVLALVTVAGVQRNTAGPPPVNQPDRRSGPGIPSTVYAVPGTGGLPLETDLGVGVAAVAMSNSSGAFVVTADDGRYHRLRLAGFDPERFRADLAGLALSPDGHQLVWSWHGVGRLGPGAHRDDTWGVRVADLTTGEVRSVPVDAGSRGLHSNPRWSPDGSYVVMDQVFGVDSGANLPPPLDADYAVERFGVVLDTRLMRLTDMFGSYLDGDLLDPWMVSPAGKGYRVVEDRLLTWEHDRGETEGRRSVITKGVADFSTGRFSPDGRWLLLAGRDLSTGLALVDVERNGGPLRVAPPRMGRGLDLLGWTDDRRVLAVRSASGDESADRELVRLTVVPAPSELASGASGPVRLAVEKLGRLVGAGDQTVVSIASDLAAGQRTTWDADAPPFVSPANQSEPDGPASARAPAAADEPGAARWTLLLTGAAVLLLAAAAALGVASTRPPRR